MAGDQETGPAVPLGPRGDGFPWGGLGAWFYCLSPLQHIPAQRGWWHHGWPRATAGALGQSGAEQETLGVVPAALVAVNNVGAYIGCGNFPASRGGWLQKQAASELRPGFVS